VRSWSMDATNDMSPRRVGIPSYHPFTAWLLASGANNLLGYVARIEVSQRGMKDPCWVSSFGLLSFSVSVSSPMSNDVFEHTQFLVLSLLEEPHSLLLKHLVILV